MGRPRHWERGQGRVEALAPAEADHSLLQAALSSRALGMLFARDDTEPYRRRLTSRWQGLLEAGRLAPGELAAVPWHHPSVAVADGDTLCCGCTTGQDCHRRWAAPFLHAAGWRVHLDGAEYVPKKIEIGI